MSESGKQTFIVLKLPGLPQWPTPTHLAVANSNTLPLHVNCGFDLAPPSVLMQPQYYYSDWMLPHKAYQAMLSSDKEHVECIHCTT